MLLYKVLKNNFRGIIFSEVLIVLLVIGFLIFLILTIVKPLDKFADARDARRSSQVRELLYAIKLSQVDNNGYYKDVVAKLNYGEVYMIVDGDMKAGCDDYNSHCTTAISSDRHCVNLAYIVKDKYMDSFPVSPQGKVAWDFGLENGDKGTGYTVERKTKSLIIRACENENSAEIFINQ